MTYSRQDPERSLPRGPSDGCCGCAVDDNGCEAESVFYHCDCNDRVSTFDSICCVLKWDNNGCRYSLCAWLDGVVAAVRRVCSTWEGALRLLGAWLLSALLFAYFVKSFFWS